MGKEVKRRMRGCESVVQGRVKRRKSESNIRRVDRVGPREDKLWERK